jgi:hypothetical protein
MMATRKDREDVGLAPEEIRAMLHSSGLRSYTGPDRLPSKSATQPARAIHGGVHGAAAEDLTLENCIGYSSTDDMRDCPEAAAARTAVTSASRRTSKSSESHARSPYDSPRACKPARVRNSDASVQSTPSMLSQYSSRTAPAVVERVFSTTMPAEGRRTRSSRAQTDSSLPRVPSQAAATRALVTRVYSAVERRRVSEAQSLAKLRSMQRPGLPAVGSVMYTHKESAPSSTEDSGDALDDSEMHALIPNKSAVIAAAYGSMHRDAPPVVVERFSGSHDAVRSLAYEDPDDIPAGLHDGPIEITTPHIGVLPWAQTSTLNRDIRLQHELQL